MRTMYCGGVIRTMETETIPQILVTEDDTIVYVGDDKAHWLPLCDTVTDLKGGCLLPGFIDAHSHFLSAAGARLQAQLEDAGSEEEIARRIREFLKNASGDDLWVIGKGYDHNLLPGKQHPTRAFLDALCPGRPVVLQHASGHMGVFSSAALAALDITEDTVSPEGGKIDLETGLLEETAFFEQLKRVPMPGFQALMDACRQTQDMYASYGITTLQEGMMVREMIPLYRAILAAGFLKLDLVGYADRGDADALYDALGEGGRHFRLGGLKIFLDGSPQGRTAWLRRPYENSTDCGYGTMRTEEVEEALEAAAVSHRQILAHCNGDAACQQYLDALRKTEEKYPQLADLRPVVIHAQLLGKDQLPAVKAVGAIPSFFVAHVYHWGDVHRRNFGEARAEAISPAASALACGLPFTFHQDTPVIPPDMLETVWCAVNRRTKSGHVLGAEEAISVEDALKAVTLHAAYQYFEEDTKGSLREGKKADLVILSEDPLACGKENLRNIRVISTVKDGQEVYRCKVSE